MWKCNMQYIGINLVILFLIYSFNNGVLPQNIERGFTDPHFSRYLCVDTKTVYSCM